MQVLQLWFLTFCLSKSNFKCHISHPLEKLLPAVTSQSDAVLWKPSRTITQQVCGPMTLILVAGVEKKPLCLISVSLSSAGAK